MAKYDQDPVFKTYEITKDYEIRWTKKLGSGISGPVRSCVHRETRKEFALKILLDRPKSRKEVTLHWLCSGNDHIVRAVDVYANEVVLPGDSQPKKRLLLVMELMEGGELFEYITTKKNFTEKEASTILKQIALAVNFCHRRNIAHRDLKPENLLLHQKPSDPEHVVIKLADFGFAKVDNGDLTTPQFTPYYVAPQVLEAQKRQKDIRMGQRSPSSPYFYDKGCDMWSMGVILYIMLCGYPPFYSEIPHQPITNRMRKRIMSGDFNFPDNEWKNISPNAKDLIQKLLCVDASQRITVSGLLDHPWVASNDVPSMDLPSPGNMLDKEALDQIKAYHSEFLQDMRREEEGFYLKPIGKSKNKLLQSRMQATPPKSEHQLTVTNEAGGRRNSVVEGVKSLLELKDICLMPPPMVNVSGESLADSMLIESVRKAITFNENHPQLISAIEAESWDHNEKAFIGMVNRKRLAECIQKILDSSPNIQVS